MEGEARSSFVDGTGTSTLSGCAEGIQGAARDRKPKKVPTPRTGWIAQWCVQASLPYRVPMDADRPGQESFVWMRNSDEVSVVLSSGASRESGQHGSRTRVGPTGSIERARACGLPWGSYPRLLLAWLATEVARTKSPEVELGRSVAEFFDKVGLVPTGGARGTITAVKEQLNRLMNATIKVQYVLETHCCQMVLGRQHSAGSEAWWNATTNGQRALWQPRIELSEDFYNLLRMRPVEIELTLINALSHSPLAIDVYFWICAKRAETDRTSGATWNHLFDQFGSQSTRHKFVENFRRAVRSVCSVEPRVQATTNRHGISLTWQQQNVGEDHPESAHLRNRGSP